MSRYRHHCTEPYCESHDPETGECVYLEHLVWCVGEHDEHGDCRHTIKAGDPHNSFYYEVVVNGNVDAGTTFEVQAFLDDLEGAQVLMAAIVAAADMCQRDIEFRESRVPTG